MSFSHQLWPVVFHWRLGDSKSLQISRIILNIFAELSSTVVWMVSIISQISNSATLISQPLKTVPSVPTSTGITVTFMFYDFFDSLARSKYLSGFFFFTFFHFHSVVVRQKSKIYRMISSIFLFLLTQGLTFWPGLVCISKSKTISWIWYSKTESDLLVWINFNL